MHRHEDDAITQAWAAVGIAGDPAPEGATRVSGGSGEDIMGLDLDHQAHLARIRHLQMLFQQDLSAQRAAGATLYSCGTGADTGRLFLQRPNGRRFEYRIRDDGSEGIIREVPLVER
jgi:hypothetical protein